MRLSQAFFQLPVLFDVARLQAEVAALPARAWVPHPDGVPGNSAVRLISAEGQESDAFYGRMSPTAWLGAMPYLCQVLAGFGVVWSRSRLMRLAPGMGVPEHADINYHWRNRVRLHIPVFTRPAVRFHCDGHAVHMGEGEAWIFDNWRRHHVENGSDADRIHLVADTTGTAAFWDFACGQTPPREQWRRLSWQPELRPQLLTEDAQRPPVMSSAEVELLIGDLRVELTCASDDPAAPARAARFGRLLESFVFDWRQLCALHGVNGGGGRAQPEFMKLAAALHAAAKPISDGLVMRGNGVSALLALEKGVLQHLVADDTPLTARDQGRAPLSKGTLS